MILKNCKMKKTPLTMHSTAFCRKARPQTHASGKMRECGTLEATEKK